MTLYDFKLKMISELSSIYKIDELNSIFNLISEDYLKLPRSKILLADEIHLDESNQSLFLSALERLKTHEPIQYVLGKASFMDLEFKVNSSVLIPRPETEELVHLICENRSKKRFKNILDVGTGSGCIILALKSIFYDTECVGLDISKAAIKTAKKNSKLLNLDVEFLVDDIFNINIKTKFDVIVSNPPYITLKEKSLMDNNVLDHEPHMALFVDDYEPLIYYKAIAKFGIQSLTKKGEIYFEINEKYGDEVVYLLNDLGYQNCEIKKDLQGKNRFVLAQLG